jgi:hypothetical protein
MPSLREEGADMVCGRCGFKTPAAGNIVGQAPMHIVKAMQGTSAWPPFAYNLQLVGRTVGMVE